MITIKIVSDKISPDANKRAKQLEKIAALAHKKWVEVTPKRSGNAKSKTKLVNRNTIHANYPYAKRLDEGYSKQAPNGMLEPTVKYLRKELDKIFRKI